jgi:hypothetical protein
MPREKVIRLPVGDPWILARQVHINIDGHDSGAREHRLVITVPN